jgi:hypothetical protein
VLLLSGCGGSSPTDQAGDPSATALATIPAGEVSSLRPATDRSLVPVLHQAKTGRARAAVRLGEDATRPFSVAEPDSGVAVTVRLASARPVPPRVERGNVIYENALGMGSHLVHRPARNGTEDHLVFPARPDQEEARYVMDVRRVPGIRLVEGSRTLELLDRDGAPRLRMSPPHALDARGVRADASVALEGCRFDTDPRAPWGRPVTDPGASECSLVVRFHAETYPAVLDPHWSTTEDMAVRRGGHSASKLADGRVLIAGGEPGDSRPWKETEIFDPTTGTWAAGAPMNVARASHAATPLLDARILFVNGYTESYEGQSSAEMWDPVTQIFTKLGPPPFSGYSHATALLDDGDVLFVGGFSELEAAVFHLATKTFSKMPLPGTWWESTLAKLPDGRVLVAGSDDGTTEIYDPGTSTFEKGPSTEESHEAGRMVALPDGRVLLVGGGVHFPTHQAVDVLPPPYTAWISLPPLSVARMEHRLSLTDDGRVLVTGGQGVMMNDDGQAIGIAECELVDVDASQILPAGILFVPRYAHTATELDSGALLIAGGFRSFRDATSSVLLCADGACLEGCKDDGECQAPESCVDGTCVGPLGNGNPCEAPAGCQSGFCAHGICCDQACDGPCVTCEDIDMDLGISGHCGPVAEGLDPYDGCDASGDPCGPDGVCGGAGVCRKVAPEYTACGDGTISCLLDRYIGAPACDGKGQCASVSSISQDCFPYGCEGTACETACSTTSPCAAGYDCVGGKCQAPLGASCATDGDCVSGHCSGGACCESACILPCETCSAKAGLPAGSCHIVAAGQVGQGCGKDECAPGCDGIHREVCTPAAPDGTSCGIGTCAEDAVARRLTCRGGECKVQTTSCSPYRCGGNGSCTTTCTKNLDCAASSVCFQERCVEVPGCLLENRSIDANGYAKTCGHFRCRDGQCLSACASDDDCMPGAGCVEGACKLDDPGSGGAPDAGAAGASSTPDTQPRFSVHGDGRGSCTCETGRSPRPGLSLLVAAAGIVLASRRRTSRIRPGTPPAMQVTRTVRFFYFSRGAPQHSAPLARPPAVARGMHVLWRIPVRAARHGCDGGRGQHADCRDAKHAAGPGSSGELERGPEDGSIVTEHANDRQHVRAKELDATDVRPPNDVDRASRAATGEPRPAGKHPRKAAERFRQPERPAVEREKPTRDLGGGIDRPPAELVEEGFRLERVMCGGARGVERCRRIVCVEAIAELRQITLRKLIRLGAVDDAPVAACIVKGVALPGREPATRIRRYLRGGGRPRTEATRRSRAPRFSRRRRGEEDEPIGGAAHEHPVHAPGEASGHHRRHADDGTARPPERDGRDGRRCDEGRKPPGKPGHRGPGGNGIETRQPGA